MFGLYLSAFLSLTAIPVQAVPSDSFTEVVQVEDVSDSFFENSTPAPADTEYPSYSVDSDGNLISSEVSPAPDVSLAPDAVDYVTYTDVENILAQAMEESTRANVNLANAYLSTSIVDCFSHVIAGLPAGTHYVAYRNNSNDSYEGYLLFGKSGKYMGDSLSFSSGTLVHYYRYSYQSGYQTYYDYRYSVEDVRDMVISLNNQSLIYTDLVDGYPTLSTSFDSDRHVSFFVIWGCVVLILYIIFRKK